MFYLRIKLICVWFKQVVRFISIKNVSVAIHIHRIPISRYYRFISPSLRPTLIDIPRSLCFRHSTSYRLI